MTSARARADDRALAVHFWRSVEDRCILWIGGTTEDGYGRMRHEGERLLAHRVAWELVNGPVPDGLLVLHTCDTPDCVNVRHLFVGTDRDNAQDRERKGRGNRFRPIRDLVQPEVVTAICLDRVTPPLVLAKRYGLSRSTVQRIRKDHDARQST